MTHNILTIEIKLDCLDSNEEIEGDEEIQRSLDIARQWNSLDGIRCNVLKDASMSPSEFIDWLCYSTAFHGMMCYPPDDRAEDMCKSAIRNDEIPDDEGYAFFRGKQYGKNIEMYNECMSMFDDIDMRVGNAKERAERHVDQYADEGDESPSPIDWSWLEGNHDL